MSAEPVIKFTDVTKTFMRPDGRGEFVGGFTTLKLVFDVGSEHHSISCQLEAEAFAFCSAITTE